MPRDDPERLDTEGVLVNAASLPAMLAFGWLLAVAHAWFVVGYLFHATYHELGHTFAAWLSGRFALPIPAILTFISVDRSAVLSSIVLAPLLGGMVWAARRRRVTLALVLATLAAVSIDLSFLTTNAQSLMWLAFAGCGGEILLSALVAASFYAPLPARARWDFWRWPFVLVACCVLVNADHQWRTISADVELLPRGTAMEGSRDANGDMDKLLRAGWTSEEIAGAYVGLADVAWLGLGALYAVRLARAWRRRWSGDDPRED
jgi:hypothetical protein